MYMDEIDVKSISSLLTGNYYISTSCLWCLICCTDFNIITSLWSANDIN